LRKIVYNYNKSVVAQLSLCLWDGDTVPVLLREKEKGCAGYLGAAFFPLTFNLDILLEGINLDLSKYQRQISKNPGYLHNLYCGFKIVTTYDIIIYCFRIYCMIRNPRDFMLL